MQQKIEELMDLRSKIASVLQHAMAQVNQLSEDERVKEYIALSKMIEKLKPRLSGLDLYIQERKMATCSHIWVNTEELKVFDGYDRYDNFYTCVKCGLDTKSTYRIHNGDFEEPLDNVMHSLLDGHLNKKTDIICDYSLAKGIYNDIIKAHPEIDDEQAVKYILHALTDIREKKVSSGVKEKRKQRLNLSQKFDDWY